MSSTSYLTQRLRASHPAQQMAAEADAQDPRRFRTVYERHFEFVWRLARGLGIPPSDLDDVAHDVFVIVQRRLDAFDPSRSMRAWLAGITRHAVLHHRRARARHSRKIAALPEPPPVPTPAELFERNEALRLIEFFLHELDPDKREVFVLMELEGLTAREVATVVDVAPATLYSRLRAARARFAAFVQDIQDSEGER